VTFPKGSALWSGERHGTGLKERVDRKKFQKRILVNRCGPHCTQGRRVKEVRVGRKDQCTSPAAHPNGLNLRYARFQRQGRATRLSSTQGDRLPKENPGPPCKIRMKAGQVEKMFLRGGQPASRFLTRKEKGKGAGRFNRRKEEKGECYGVKEGAQTGSQQVGVAFGPG